MKAVIQRVKKAHIDINTDRIATIDDGLCVLLGIHHDDTPKQCQWIINKLLTLRLFDDDHQQATYTVKDKQYSLLIISQFTLYGECQKGRRPNFSNAAPASIAKPLYQHFITTLKSQYPHVQSGKFGSMMQVSLTNDGPVTLILER